MLRNFWEVKVENFCTKSSIKVSAENFLKAVLAHFCVENVVRGNAVQIWSDFPAKRLGIFLKSFSWQIKHYWTKLKCCNYSESKKENEIKDKLKNTFFILLFVLLFLIVVVEVNKLLFFKKKIRRMRRGRAVFFLSLLEPHSNHIFVKTRN